MKFDELHKLDYFGPMAISEEDKDKRRELADLLTDVFLYFFATYDVYQQYNKMLERAEYESLLNDRISDAVSKVTGIDAEMSNHIRQLSKEIIDTTIKHTKIDNNSNPDTPLSHLNSFGTSSSRPELLETPDTSGNSHIDDENQLISKEADEVEDIMGEEATTDYWLSIHRAINIAQNEANTFMNYSDFVNAKNKGYTHKTWLTMLDKLVRDTHEEVEGVTIGIDEYFVVGNSEMRFPHDWELAPDPKETVNCRCAIDYTK